jgi:hypothetical protein
MKAAKSADASVKSSGKGLISPAHSGLSSKVSGKAMSVKGTRTVGSKR